ncbi:hypothetical protein ACC764_27550 [Rhizobium ruizarguesonis]|jgi:hypothetical protein|uniref:hypothetical protein n=1 Tax=Rhizobium laguerreae TaxID=1076926 RepID=UPI001C916BF7|nr:hypothetical protein [Rhizobium laguerreae]MBY3123484.1 hypothetical protein [Rhizobium laguerreae]
MSGTRKTLKQQIEAMSVAWPMFRVGKRDRVKRSGVWSGILKPQFTAYRIEVRYAVGSNPEVRILSPELERLPGNEEGSLPHVYGPSSDPTLCLYDPLTDEWNSTMLIAEKIIPWTIDWLTFYEFWLMTGVWSGGGRHPTPLTEEISA